MLDLEAIKKRAEAATPGPWFFDANGDFGISTKADAAGSWTVIVCGMLDEHDQIFEDTYPIGTSFDGEFIAHAREDIPALIAEVERLQAKVDHKSQLLDQMGML